MQSGSNTLAAGHGRSYGACHREAVRQGCGPRQREGSRRHVRRQARAEGALMRPAIVIGLPSTTAQVDDPQQCEQDQRKDRREQQRSKAAQLIGK